MTPIPQNTPAPRRRSFPKTGEVCADGAGLPQYALSIRQPWAHLILTEGKDIENRDWPTRFRGPVLIHAGKGMTNAEWVDAMDFVDDAFPLDTEARLRRRARAHNDAPRGGIVGVAEIVDCVTASASPWFLGRYGFVLRNARPLPFRPCRGQLGFFRATEEAPAQGGPAL